MPDHEFSSGWNSWDHKRSDKCNKYAGWGIKAEGICEGIERNTQQECRCQKQPARGFERKEQDKINIKIRIDVTAELNIIQDQHLEEDQENKTSDIF